MGNQAHLSPILQFTHRVINKVAIETGFPCTPTICVKDSDGGGEGVLVCCFGQGGGRLLQRGRLFGEIRYLICRIERSANAT